MSIHHIARARSCAQRSDAAGHPRVESLFDQPVEELGETRLAGAALPPSLGHATRRGNHLLPTTTSRLDKRSDLAVTPLEGDQRPGVQDQTHSGRPRTTAASRLVENVFSGPHLSLG